MSPSTRLGPRVVLLVSTEMDARKERVMVTKTQATTAGKTDLRVPSLLESGRWHGGGCGGTAPVIAASRDGRRLGAGVRTWGTMKCARGQLWPLRPQNVCAVDVSPDGMRITTDRTARLPASGRSRLASDCSARCNTYLVAAATFSPDGVSLQLPET